ncbi:FAD-dependent oxidoreductase [Marinicella gelatinilytica]|uniref:FAD-dependent oxidoreductase n=1 Tax=Marinicella gelatinilytica TaxID=2996017 RepID=UPI002260B3D1|nr:FAD-dependent oxidoreductase [Marinicella gelatinilytica]MCX7545971.1 FAD-dependent oxidoreductase [Marinicella gelatinilytica]
MASETTDCDVIIVGGGMVGLATALSLASQDYRVHLLEAGEPQQVKTDTHPSFDDRTLVVNPASQLFWEKLGVWSELAPHSTVVNSVHVSQNGRFGAVRFNHDAMHVPHLAHVIEARVLGRLLWEKVYRHKHIQLTAPAKLTHFTADEKSIQVHYQQDAQQKNQRALLLLAADGARSFVREQLNLPTITKNYHRTAIIANVATELSHHQCAYERLTASGPMALLPFHDRLGLVWTLPQEQAKQMLDTDDATFMDALQHAMGHRLGRITRVGQRSSYPLYRITVPQQYKSRVLLIGNAAHTVSPVSAQGLNLGVRGIQRLMAALSDARKQNHDIGSDLVLEAYQQQSWPDQQRILQYTDDLMTWFKLDVPVINGLRGLGMLAVDSSLLLKKQFYRLAGGF